jgi:N-methylhydantoinase A
MTESAAFDFHGKDRRQSTMSAAGKLINIDNGGTLTDICVIDGSVIHRTKTLTTPHDLSRCLFDGLRKASRVIYGEEDLLQLLLSTQHIRYSTTQGTNALVERKGPRLGLVTGGGLHAAQLRNEPGAAELFDALLGDRSHELNVSLMDAEIDCAATSAINSLASLGASRIVVALGGANRIEQEKRVKSLLLRRFPPHLLGATPILYSHEVVADDNDVRRAWTAVFNAYLHPEMEKFLYAAEHKLLDSHTRNPLLIFRNDGYSARVAKTIAIKTYSSGPRGGMEGSRALAAHYGFKQLLSMDVGGTTTDIGFVAGGSVREQIHGKVQGVNVSFPLSDVHSVGVGGSSIINVAGTAIKVGPQSVGSTPGPACFGLGGKEATITDAFLAQGLLDPATFFGGELNIDVARANAAIETNVAKPLGLTIERACVAMEEAWVRKIADNLKAFTEVTPDTILSAFGGGGPLIVCTIAEAAGISRVLIPGLAAVFSAFGVGFSDIAHQYDAPLGSHSASTLKTAIQDLKTRAARGMAAEGIDLEECEIQLWLQISDTAGERRVAIRNNKLPAGISPQANLSLSLVPVRTMPRPRLTGRFGGRTVAARAGGQRCLWIDGQRRDVPLYRAEEQSSGVTASGPAVLEEAFYTCRIEPGWRFEFNSSGDILLSRAKLKRTRGTP